MANPTMTLIASNTVGSGGAGNFTFSSIPATYTDLKVVISPKADSNPYGENFIWYELGINGQGSYVNITSRDILNNGSSTVSSGTNNSQTMFMPTTANSNNFGSTELYFPNYTSSNNKSISVDSVAEWNGSSGTNNAWGLSALLWSQTSTISSLTFYARSGSGTSFAQYSTFYLYGINNS